MCPCTAGPQSSGRTGGARLAPEAAWSSLSRRFCSQVALTPEEREQRALYAAILEYDQDHVSPAGQVRGGGGGKSRGSRQRMWGHVGLMVLGLPCAPGRASAVRPGLGVQLW